MSDLTVDVATRADLPALVESVSGLFQDDAGRYDPYTDLSWPAREGVTSYGRDIDDPAVLLLLARRDGRALGHLVGRLREPSAIRPYRFAILESLRVAPDARGAGVGGRLVEAFFDWAREHRADQAVVTAYAANNGAQRFYARHGFAPHDLSMRAPV